MDNQNKQMVHYKPDLMANKYYILDTTIGYDHTADVEAMNGRQGDNMRSIPIAFTDDGQPHDLTDTKITLKVLDASGVVKVSDKIINLVDAKAGLVIFGVPDRVYESVGQVQRAYFTLEDKLLDGSTQTISTVNVSFRVLENGIDITKAQSTIYISSLDRVIGGTEPIVTTSGNNHLTGKNIIDNLTIKNLVNDEVEAIKSNLDQATTNVTTNTQAIAKNTTAIDDLNKDLKTVQAQAGSVSNLSVGLSNISDLLTDTNSDVDSLSTAIKSVARSDAYSQLSESASSIAFKLSDLQASTATLSHNLSVTSSTVDDASAVASTAKLNALTASTEAHRAYVGLSGMVDNLSHIDGTSATVDQVINNIKTAWWDARNA